ncbi:UDP-glucuronosyltransferase 3A1-like [Polyodon spathula]|uniref:UDP-glucuronosyltransferase 3A1-like n=1 Tax=Polyodon spathula TaxID=7913 RepID=UPI001B7E4C1A|nr:UDP-glucuronosyltransferase 3A1-like [Polyodon spathula]
MASRALVLVLLFLEQSVPSESAKILTVCLIGGSHYMLLDEISHTFHERGHKVRMLLQMGIPIIEGLNYAGRPNSYQITKWSVSEEYIKEYNTWFFEKQKEFLQGRDSLSGYIRFMGQLAHQCDYLLGDSQLKESLKQEKFDIALLDAFNPCSFLVAEWLGLPYVAFFPGNLLNAHQIALPSPLSYVPVYRSQLSDHMDFWGRTKNVLMFLCSSIAETHIQAPFHSVIQKHFRSDMQPSLSDLYRKAELWAFNTDFSLEFPQPLMPNTLLVGGLLSKPPEPVTQDLEEFISKFGEAGFVVVTLGSMLSSVPLSELLQEMNAGFALIPQAVIWRYHRSQWPEDLQPAANVKLVEWLPQNDLLGHPSARLLVTHGGQNSLMQAVYHAVPVLGIPLFGDQFDNMVRAEVKGLGLALEPTELRREDFARIMRRLITDKRYKTSALALSEIHHSHPLPPGQRLEMWVEHILQSGGGAHLRTYSLQQPLYQQYLIDVILGLVASLLLLLYTLIKIGKTVNRLIRNTGKLKSS